MRRITPVTTNPAATLYDVAKGTTTIQQFVAGLSVTQLANIVEGGRRQHHHPVRRRRRRLHHRRSTRASASRA